MDLSSWIFYILAGVTVAFSSAMVFTKNPLHSALYLAGTMISLAFLYFNLKAYFVGAVQLIVYAGAVMVLFVMVVMVFDQKEEESADHLSSRTARKGASFSLLKVGLSGVFLGFTAGLVRLSANLFPAPVLGSTDEIGTVSTKALAKVLFTEYVAGFELLGFLLLVVAVGVVSIARARGGTHADQ